MNKILIGSQALTQYFPDYKICKDIDIATLDKKQSMKNWGIIIEFKPIPALFNYQSQINWNNPDLGVASLNMLYTIKCSHLSWDIHWNKTAFDIIFMKSQGAILISELYQELYEYWSVIHKNKKHIKLNVSNDKFFNNNLTYNIDHDLLHQKYKFYDVPLFEMCKVDKSKAMLSKAIFDSWSRQMQLELAIEEIRVIAEERFKGSTMLSIKHLILSMTKGWFNTFLIDNLEELIKVT